MVWTTDGTKINFDDTALRAYLNTHPNVKYLLGFNEPNFTNQANITPQQAAAAWPKMEKVAQDYGLKLVSPAVNYSPNASWVSNLATLPTLPSGMAWRIQNKQGEEHYGEVNINDPFNWLTAFFAYYPTAKVDYIACHCYMNTASVVIGYVNDFITKFNRPVWLTEYCGWDNGITKSGQESYMRETIASFDANPNVFRYAWFFGRDLYTVAPYSSLLTPNYGELSTLGKIYANLEDPIDPNAPDVINNAITIKVIDKTKGAVTNSAAWPNQSVYTWLGQPNNNWTPIGNGAGVKNSGGSDISAAGMYYGLPGGNLVKTATEWTWSFSFEAAKSTKYQWNPDVIIDANKTENAFTKMSSFTPKLNGGADLIFNTDATGKATGQLTVIIENTTTITVSNTETQNMSTITIPKQTTSLGRGPKSTLDVTIYPNPADEFITIECDKEIESVQIYNITGALVLASTASNYININSSNKGVYMLVIESINGDKSFKKVVKQ
ncbi:MAG: T9SS type A sorting domain-containing protein [Breznakibacter sp.]|nr:T9SS type A sorting domain-containing protein [Breznakibacter sp.]